MDWGFYFEELTETELGILFWRAKYNWTGYFIVES